MIFATIGTIENSMVNLADYLNIETKDGEKYRDIHKKLINECEKLHSEKELEKLAEQFIVNFLSKYGEHELRIWYEIYAPTFGDESLFTKYNKLIKEINSFVEEWLELQKLILKVDVYIFGIKVKEEYRKIKINFDDGEYTQQLWGILKTIREENFKKELINLLLPKIKLLITISGGDYFNNLDLTKQNNLEKIYSILCEVLHTNEAFKGHELFYSYDGYGNILFNGELDYGNIREN